MNKKILLIDSNSILHRAYHAIPNLTTSKGQPTGAIFGFLKILIKLIQSEEPTHIAAVFDAKGPTFRHKMYDSYKATRKPMDNDLAVQLEPLKNILSLMNIKIIEMQGYEADDLIGTLAKRFDEPTIIVTGDRDSFQLVDETTKVYWTKKGVSEIEVVDLEYLKGAGFTPSSYLDYKGLMGDSSDNVPGIPGVGEKTAKDLIFKYQSLDEILSKADEIPGKVGEKVRLNKEIAILSRELCRIETNAPIECSLNDIEYKKANYIKLSEKLKELEMTSLLKSFESDEVKEQEKTELKYGVTELSNLDDIKRVLKGAGDKIALIAGSELSFAFDETMQYSVSLQKDLFSEGADFSEALKTILSQDAVFIFYDTKPFIRLFGFRGKYFDISLAYHLANGCVTPKGLSHVLEAEGLPYSPCSMIVLYKRYQEKIKEMSLDRLVYDIEFPLVKVLADMESRGVSVDIKVLDELSKKYDKMINETALKIYALAKERFNIASPRQLGEILYDKMGLKRGKKTKTGYSVDEEALSNLKGEHEIIDEILKWRHLSKLQGTYVTGLRPLVKDGKLHTEFNQVVTATGRLSSVNPNLQNLPARSAEAAEIKKAFIGSQGGVLISADYSQIELRLLAHFSEDERLIEAYKTSEDIHAITASAVFKVPLDKVTSQMRRDAKAVNFGIIYGISGYGLSQNIGMPVSKAKEFIEAYFEMYPKVKTFMDNCVKKARDTGYAITLFGRKRALPDINSSNAQRRNAAERMAMNTPLQGSAAEIVKIAMLSIEERLKDFKSKMILQVHDELIVDAAKEEADEVIKILVEEMSNAAKLKVPLVVNYTVAENWGLLK